MANSDDELPPDEGAGAPASSDGERPKKTLIGLGFKVPRPPRPPTPSPTPTSDDFEAEATQIAEHLMEVVLEDLDEEIDDAFGTSALPDIPIDEAFHAEATDAVEDGEFTAEATQIAQELQFPEDRSAPELGASGSTLAQPARSDADWRANVPSDLLDSQAPLPHGDDLPAAIHTGEPAPFRRDPQAPRDGEFPAEKTELLNSPFEQDPSVAKLITLDGPLVGHEFFASGLRNTVGRGLNNSIVVADLAMSRQHFEIVKNADESFTLHDLQSVNGTVLNGTKVREADIFHGDRVEAGKSTFQFVVTGNPPSISRQRRLVPAATSTMAGVSQGAWPAAPARVASAPMNRLIIPLSVAALVVSLVIIAGLAMMVARTTGEAADADEKPAASQIYLEGVEAVKARDWNLAEAKFAAAGQRDPSLTGIPEQLRRIELERLAQKTLLEARALAQEGHVDEAKQRIGSIPSSSIYFAEAQEVARDSRKVEIERLYADAQAAMTAEDIERARELTSQLFALVPTHQGAQDIRERIDALERREAEAVAEAETTADEAEPVEAAERSGGDDFTFELVGKSKSSSPKPSRRTQKSLAASGSARVPNFTQGFVLYRTRRFDEAQSFFERAGAEDGPAAALARKLAGQIDDFKTAYEQGKAAYAAKNWAEADRMLLAAKRADSAISSNAGQFDGELSVQLASVKANLGLDALQDNKPVKARRYLEQAESFERNGSDTKVLRAALDKEATALYVQAANMRKSDPAAAAKLCRTIMDIVPRSNDVHLKAEKLLKSL